MGPIGEGLNLKARGQKANAKQSESETKVPTSKLPF